MGGTLEINAYIFGRNARPVADHRLCFVQSAEELKIETVADAVVYKPGDEYASSLPHNVNGRQFEPRLRTLLGEEIVGASRNPLPYIFGAGLRRTMMGCAMALRTQRHQVVQLIVSECTPSSSVARPHR